MSNPLGPTTSRPIAFDPYGARNQGGSPPAQRDAGGRAAPASDADRVMLSAQAQAALNARRNDLGVLDQAGRGLPAVGDVVQDFLKSMGGNFDFGDLDLKDLINKQLLEPAATAIAQLPKDGSAAAAGAGYLALEGISVTMRQSDRGIDISIQKISLKAAIAYGADGTGSFSGFAAEVTASRTDLHIGGDAAPALVLQPLGPGDPRRLDDQGRQRTDFGFIPDLQKALETMEQITDAWRELLDRSLGEDRATDRPALLMLRDRRETDDGLNLLFDLFQPLSPSPRDGSSA